MEMWRLIVSPVLLKGQREPDVSSKESLLTTKAPCRPSIKAVLRGRYSTDSMILFYGKSAQGHQENQKQRLDLQHFERFFLLPFLVTLVPWWFKGFFLCFG
jgi:hypothetical protein